MRRGGGERRGESERAESGEGRIREQESRGEVSVEAGRALEGAESVKGGEAGRESAKGGKGGTGRKAEGGRERCEVGGRR